MHELSIVEAVLDAVRRAVGADDQTRVRGVQVRVGQLRQVVPEMLAFWFAAAVHDTVLAAAQLIVEQIPARARCPVCRKEFAVDDQWFTCPGCGALGAEVLSGTELDLTGIELEQPRR